MPKAMLSRLPSHKKFVYQYVARLSGPTRLTDTELLVLILIVWEFYIRKERGEGEIARRKAVLSPEGRSDIRLQFEAETKRSMSVQNFNNYIKSLKDKGMIIAVGDHYDINPWLYPVQVITFKYEVSEDINKYLG